MVSGRNLIPFKLSCMAALPARMGMIESKMKELECSQDFSNCKSMGIFQIPRAANSQFLVRILNSSEM